jgi:hypothetical protein
MSSDTRRFLVALVKADLAFAALALVVVVALIVAL